MLDKNLRRNLFSPFTEPLDVEETNGDRHGRYVILLLSRERRHALSPQRGECEAPDRVCHQGWQQARARRLGARAGRTHHLAPESARSFTRTGVAIFPKGNRRRTGEGETGAGRPVDTAAPAARESHAPESNGRHDSRPLNSAIRMGRRWGSCAACCMTHQRQGISTVGVPGCPRCSTFRPTPCTVACRPTRRSLLQGSCRSTPMTT